jgi:hypothetical protein
MPDFTVIEGGGDRKRSDRNLSQQYFEDFVLTLLRALARGEGAHQLREQFFRFIEHAQKKEIPIGQVFDAAVKNLHQRAFDAEGVPSYEAERKDVTQAAIRVIAESMALDSAARARLSSRVQDLTQAIEEKILASEERSREHGWSYVQRLTERLGKWPPRQK